MNLEEAVQRLVDQVSHQVRTTHELIESLQADAKRVVDVFDIRANATFLELPFPQDGGTVIIRQIIGNCGPGAGFLYIGRRRIAVNGAINLPGPMRWQNQEKVTLFSGDDTGAGYAGTGAAGQLYLEIMGNFAPPVPKLLS